jgi:hypothetical protein
MDEIERNAQRYAGKYVKPIKSHHASKIKSYELPRVRLMAMAHSNRAPHRKGAI